MLPAYPLHFSMCLGLLEVVLGHYRHQCRRKLEVQLLLLHMIETVHVVPHLVFASVPAEFVVRVVVGVHPGDYGL